MYFIKDTISVSLSTSPTSVVYGSNAVLTATITSEVAVSSITWQKVPSDGSPIKDLNITGGEYTQTPSEVGPGSFTLTINSVDFGDGGTYQVKVSNAASKDNTSNPVSVTVTGGKSIHFFLYKLNDRFLYYACTFVTDRFRKFYL